MQLDNASVRKGMVRFIGHIGYGGRMCAAAWAAVHWAFSICDRALHLPRGLWWAQTEEAPGRLREVMAPYIRSMEATFAPLRMQLQFTGLREDAWQSSEFGELARRLKRSLGGPDRV